MEHVQQEHQVASKALSHTHQATSYLFTGYRVLGVQIPARGKVAYILYSLIVNGLVTIYLPLSFAVSYFTMSSEELRIGALLTSIQVAINDWGCAIKFGIMASLLPKLHTAEAIFEKLDARCSEPLQQEELRRMIKQSNRFVILFAVAYWSYSSSTFLGAFIMGRPPYSLYNPFINWRDSYKDFIVVAFMEYGLISVACFQQVVDDSYAVIYVCILRTHVRLLLQRIKRLGSNPNLTPDENLAELKRCILDHKNLLALYGVIAPIISITIFIQFMITATLLGATLINVFIFATDLSSKVACGFYIIAVVVEIFPLCYYAQCLIDESNRIATTIFHSNWLNQDPRFRQMLIFFIQRTQRNIELSAAKLFPINLNSFLSIAKFSFTLYTFIKEMGIKEKYGLD